jgi:NADPH-dependent ferric siderophore reductase
MADPTTSAVERMVEMVGRPGTPLADAALWHLVVEANEALTDQFRRVTFAGAGLEEITYAPGQDLMFRIPVGDDDATNRRYTIRRAQRDRGTLDVDIVVHGDRPGARWAVAAVPGTEVDAIGPRGSVRIDEDADWHLFVGDETALPGMLAMAEALPAALPATILAEVPRVVDGFRPDLAEHRPVRVVWIERGELPPGGAERLAAASGGFEWPGEGRGHVYIAGEMRVVRALRELFEQRGLLREQISAKAYWRRGDANAAHGEPLDPDRSAPRASSR